MTLLKKSLVPAALLAIMMFLVTLFMAHTIVKQADTMIPDEVMKKMVLAPHYFAFGRFLLDNVIMIVIAALAMLALISYTLPRWRPTNPIRAFLDRWFAPWTFYARLQTSFALMTLAAMMQSGVPFQKALQDLMRTAPPWLRSHIARALDRLAHGKTQIDALLDRFLPVDIEDRLTIYARLPEFDAVMDRVARDSLDRLMNQAVVVGKTVNIIMMIGMASFLLATMGSMGEVGLSLDPRNMQKAALEHRGQ